MFEDIILDDEVRGFLMGCLAFARHETPSRTKWQAWGLSSRVKRGISSWDSSASLASLRTPRN